MLCAPAGGVRSPRTASTPWTPPPCALNWACPPAVRSARAPRLDSCTAPDSHSARKRPASGGRNPDGERPQPRTQNRTGGNPDGGRATPLLLLPPPRRRRGARCSSCVRRAASRHTRGHERRIVLWWGRPPQLLQQRRPGSRGDRVRGRGVPVSGGRAGGLWQRLRAMPQGASCAAAPCPCDSLPSFGSQLRPRCLP